MVLFERKEREHGPGGSRQPGKERRVGYPQPVTATTRDSVAQRVAVALDAALASGALPQPADGATLPEIEIARPQNPEHGDYSTNLALKLAGVVKRPPRDVAAALLAALDIDASDDLIVRGEIASPGFVNVWLAPRHVEAAVDSIRQAGLSYGRTQQLEPRALQRRVRERQPDRPADVGNARGAFVGDLLSRVLEAVGHEVTREYYFNDSGARSTSSAPRLSALRRRRAGARRRLPRRLRRRGAASCLRHRAGPTPRAAGEWASERIRDGIETSLEHLGVHFDVWKSEGSLHAEGWVGRGIEKLKAAGQLYEQDGALWFRSTDFGDDKDRVVIRSNGEPTYFASDIGYVVEKFSRGFDELIYVWGADHHGTVARLKNAAQALGLDRDAVSVLLIAWVRFVRDGEEVSMSKRAGEFVTLDELLAEVGVDAARWYFASRAPSTGIDFDIELAKKESSENPVYYVQYAHARISSILRKAADAGLAPAASVAAGLADDDVALAMAKDLLQLPDIVRDAAAARETQAITTYATNLATTFHAFYRDRRVVDADDPTTSAYRLALVDATRSTLAAALGLLGISAPESM